MAKSVNQKPSIKEHVGIYFFGLLGGFVGLFLGFGVVCVFFTVVGSFFGPFGAEPWNAVFYAAGFIVVSWLFGAISSVSYLHEETGNRRVCNQESRDEFGDLRQAELNHPDTEQFQNRINTKL